MKVLSRLEEKINKLFKYAKLKKMFLEDNEFARIHPELVDIWEKKFRQMIRYSSDRTFPIVEEFLSVHLDRVSNSRIKNDNRKSPVVICAIKNDMEKIPYFMEHYRKLGIEEFVFVDNMSTDGTFEYLIEQTDTVVFRCNHPFTADRKIAWMNRLVAEIGDDTWILMVDSDEFAVYINNEIYDISNFITICHEKGYKRLGSIMLDMYSRGELFESDLQNSFIEKFKYFDKDTYEILKANIGIKIKGGPRKRVFGTEMKLSKYALFYFEKDDVIPSAHYLIPYEKGFNVPLCIGLLHYKFINESDYDKVVEAVDTEMHSDNSAEYKSYYAVMKKNPKVTFYDERHSILLTEENIQKLGILEDIFSK